MGTFPYEYDRVMGVTSVGSQESVRFGEEHDPETEKMFKTRLLTAEKILIRLRKKKTYTMT